MRASSFNSIPRPGWVGRGMRPSTTGSSTLHRSLRKPESDSAAGRNSMKVQVGDRTARCAEAAMPDLTGLDFPKVVEHVGGLEPREVPGAVAPQGHRRCEVSGERGQALSECLY